MGIRRALRLVEGMPGTEPGAPATGVAPPLAVSSPWSGGDLARVVWGDLVGVDALPVTRAEAMAVPAIARARHLLVSTIGRMPLREYAGDTPTDPQPSWCQRTDSVLSPQHRMAWTVDDLLFHGMALWAVTRAADTGLVLTADRVPWDHWSLTPEGQVEIAGRPVSAADVILIPGLHEGLTEYASATIRDATTLRRSAQVASENPTPVVELHQTEGDPLNDDEIAAAVDQWRKARRTHGVGYTSASVELKTHGAHPEQLLIEGRNASSVDCARMVGVPASMVDATTATASLTYETTAGRNAEFVDYGLALYMTPISARLSLDDVVARGHRVALDLTDLTSLAPPATGPITED